MAEQHIEHLKQQISELQAQVANLQTALQHQETQYQAMLENSPGMIIRCRLAEELQIEFVSDASEAIYGFTAEEMIEQGSLLTQAIVPSEREAFLAMLQQAAKERHKIEWEGPIYNRYGQKRWILFTARITEHGKTSIIDGVVTDVSAHHEAIERQERLLSILEATSDIVAITNRAGQFEYLNQAGKDIIGVTDDEGVKNIHFSQLYPETEVQQFLQEIIPTAMQEGLWSGELHLQTKDGTLLPISQVLMAHMNADGTPRFFSTLLRDLTALKQAEAERLAYQERIIEMQHSMIAELSTPLIPFTEDILVLPLIGTIDSMRAQTMIDTVLQGIAQQGARAVIIDITGVAVIDTQVASIFLQLARSIRLLGAHTILTGIRPEVAQTIVGLGIDFSQLITHNDLQAGIRHALQVRR